MDFNLIKTTRDFSVEYGTFLGIVWLATFLIFVTTMTGGNIFMMMMAMFCMTLTVIMPFYLAWRYKQHLLKPGDQVSWGTAWLFAILMFLYASIFTGVGQFLYFNYIDRGQLIDFFSSVLSAPETQRQYELIGATDLLEQTKDQLALLAQLSPFDIAISMFGNNITISIMLSIPVAFMAHRKCRDMKSFIKIKTESQDTSE